MWHGDEREWRLHRPEFSGAALDPDRAAGPWFGHRWFAYDLVRWGRPDVVVELGTHYGVSFFAFCQAVSDAGYPAGLHAVDTWAGDPHAGEYGEEVIEVVQRIQATAYPHLDITLHRCFFSEALDRFPDESVDLLHIDGFHTYDAVRDDFETWLPKLAPGGIVLFHDVAHESGYGSADYYAELATQFPSLTFPHSFGLGVLAPKGVGENGFVFGTEMDRWAPYYEAQAAAYLGDLVSRTQERMIGDRDDAIASQARLVDEYAAALRAQEAAFSTCGEELAKERQALVDALGQRRTRARSIRAVAAPLLALRGQVATARSSGPLTEEDGAASGGPTTAVEGVAARVLRAARLPSTGRHRSVVRSFDPDYYLTSNDDVRRKGLDPLAHYRRFGARERRDPSALFWSHWYVSEHADVNAAGVDPFRHYLVHGWREGREPSPLFRATWYLEQSPAARHAGVSPLEYWWTTGFADGDFVHPEQRRRALALAPAEPLPTRRVVACALDGPPGGPQSVLLDDLVEADVDLITLDLWDTMVARQRPADAAKLATARRMYLAHRGALPAGSDPWALAALRLEVEAKLAATEPDAGGTVEVLTQVLAQALGVQPDAVRPLAEPLAVAEVADEVRGAYAVDDVVAFLERVRARAHPPLLAVTVDASLGEDAVRSVLTACGYAASLPVFSWSGGVGSASGAGTMGAAVRDAFGVAPERHLHIVATPAPEHRSPLDAGAWTAVVELSPTGYPGPGALGPDDVATLVEMLGRELRTLVPVLASADVGDARSIRAAQAGVMNALLPVAVVAAAVEEATCRGLDRVYYASRVGAFLARVHDAVAPVLVGPDAPHAVHLEVSRRSTYGPSVKELSRDELARKWSQYPDQSPRALLTSLGLDPEPFAAGARAAGLELDTLVRGIADDPRVSRWLERPDVRSVILAALDRDRTALREYLDGVLDPGTDDVVVVDVGWRGTIQDNLARVLPERHVVGVYLGLFPFLNPQPANVTKRAVALDGNLDHEFSFVDPPAAVEAPWTPDIPSVIGYRRAEGGPAEPVREREGPRTSALIDVYQDAAVRAAATVGSWMVANGLTVGMLRSELGDALRRYYEQPLGGVADIWFGSTHDDTFGVLNDTPYRKLAPPRAILADAAVVAQNYTSYAETPEARESRWPAGYRAWLPVQGLEILRQMWGELH